MDVDNGHRIHLTPLVPPAAVREILALSVEGRVEAGRVRSTSLGCRVMAEDGGVTVYAEALRPHEPVTRLLPQLYVLCAGLHRAGFDLRAEGPLASLLPGGGALAHAPDQRPAMAARVLFCRQRAPSARPPELSIEQLVEVHDTLAAGRNLKELEKPPYAERFPRRARHPIAPDDRSFEHRSGALVHLVLAGAGVHAHSIVNPALVGPLVCDEHRLEPLAASSYGEVWLDVNGDGSRVCPTEVVGDEVAVVMAGRLLRFRVVDRGTLEWPGGEPSHAAFGDGPPLLLGTGSLLESARVLAQRKQLGIAREAAALALRGAAGADERREAQAALDLAEAALRWEQAPPGSTKTVPIRVRPLAELIDVLGRDGAKIDAIAEACTLERQEAADYRRDVGRLPPGGGTNGQPLAHRYEGITGADVLAAAIPLETLEQLGDPRRLVWPSLEFPEIFTVRLGSDVIWGSARTGAFVVLGEPDVVYVR